MYMCLHFTPFQSYGTAQVNKTHVGKIADRWPNDASRQGIGLYAIDLLNMEYPTPCMRYVGFLSM